MNDVIIRIKVLDEGGSETVKKIAMDADALRRTLDTTAESGKRLNGELVNTASVGMAFQNLKMGLDSINGQVLELTETYGHQEDAELKLETIMRQRMKATEEDTDAVKKYASAQQKLGVVGDEVQLAGAQQIATFVNQRSTLEALIPAMNNLLVQRKGLNGTEEDAVEIGNLMGKAMQGQTTMLQRVGITFSESEAKAIKYGNEQQRAAMLAEVITNNVGEMNAEFAKTDAGKAKQMANAFGDMKEQVGKVLTPMAPLITAFNTFTSSIFSIGMMATGFKSLAAALSISTLRTIAHTAASSAQAAVSGVEAGACRLLGYSLEAEAISAGTATVATKAFGASLTLGLSVVVTAVVTLLGEMIQELTGVSESEDGAAEGAKRMSAAEESLRGKQEEARRSVDNARAELIQYTNRLKEACKTKVEDRDLVEELNQKYGDAMGTYASVSEWYKVMTANSELYCKQLVNEAEMSVLAAQAAQQRLAIQERKGPRKISYGEDTSREQMDRVDADNAQNQSQYDRETQGMNNKLNNIEGRIRYLSGENNKISGTMLGNGSHVTADKTKATTKTDKSDNGRPMDDAKIATASYKDLGDAITYYQKKLDGTKSSDTDSIQRLSAKIGMLNEAQTKIKDTQTASTLIPGSLNDIDNQIKQLQARRGNATADALAGIDLQINKLQAERSELENQGIAQKKLRDLNTYDDLSKALAYYQDRMKTSNSEERAEIQKTISAINAKTKAMELMDQKLNRPTDNGTMSSLDEQLNWLKQQQENARGAAVSYYQAQINEIEKEKSALQGLIDIENDRDKLNELGGKGKRELTLELKETGYDGIAEKIRKLQNMLNDPRMGLDDKMRGQISGQIQQWTKYQQQLAKSQTTFRNVYGSVKNAGDGIVMMGEALKGNGTAWQKTTKIVDAGLQVYDGIGSIIKIMKALGIITDVQTGKETVSAAAKAVTATESTALVTASTADTSAMTAESSAVSSMTAHYSALAAAKTFAAHASLMFVGTGLASGMVAMQQSIIAAASIPKFAKGVLAYGPTLGLFGEYPGAGSNPEVVAPLDRLKDIIGSGGGTATGGKVVFRIQGRELVGILEAENSRRSRR